MWPGVIAAVLLLLARFGLKAVIPGFKGFSLAMLWSFGAAAVILLWWLFFSRARWSDRVGGLVLMIAGLAATWQLRHESMGPLWLAGYALPFACVGLVAGAAAGRRLGDGRRRATIVAALLFACGVWTLVRTEGIDGDHNASFRWRWTASAEQRLLAGGSLPPAPATHPAARPAAVSAADATADRARVPAQALDRPARDDAASTALEWPGFRGAHRDSVVRTARINTDWSASPPLELWRQPIGPGWSSFAVRGDLIYTQEQRGDEEVVACYRADTGVPVWAHRDATRFFESNGGAGPRGTPTLSGDHVYTLGATGIVNVLDAADGAVVWSRNAASDTGVPLPAWGFSSSPVVAGNVVIVALSGTLVAYDATTGNRRWTGEKWGESYSSPQLMTVDGVPQIVHLSGNGAAGVSPADGAILWVHQWKGSPIVQPALTADGDVLIAATAESGIRRITVTRGPGGWTAERRWSSNGLKPYFNDFVMHKGHAYGFDGRILACIDLGDGTRKWKGGRYGNGQLVLLADQDLLLVLSEDGELALVNATPNQFTEVARFKAIEGKTWNHPVVVGDTVLVRNGEEMAAFRLPRRRE